MPRLDRLGRRLAVPAAAAAAGLVLSLSAVTAHGTSLRPGLVDLADLVRQREATVTAQQRQEQALRVQVAARTDLVARDDAPVAAARARGRALLAPAGLTAVRGPALSVSLDDAPRQSGGGLPAGATADDVVVHQQDVQSVVNALWAGGAEAMTLMGRRVIATTAVRCVGNTLLLAGRVYSPPFTVTAIGPVAGMRAALDADRAVSVFREYVAVYGLGYRVRTLGTTTLPAYDGPLGVTGSGS